MQPTDVTSAYIQFASAATAEQEVLGAGRRARVYSVVWVPRGLGGNGYQTGLQLLNGSGGDVYYQVSTGRYSSSWGYNSETPCRFPLIPRNGILFTDGIYVKPFGELNSGAFVGVRAVTLTFQAA